jgi:hypothetical protein
VISPWIDPRDRFTLQAEDEIRASLRPIYRNSARKPRPVHLASCLLLEIDGAPTICTAAHVADHSREHDLYIGGVEGGRPVHIPQGAFVSTLAPGGNRDDDHFDYAFWQPPSLAAVAALGGATFMKVPESAAESAPTQTRLFTAIGYARSRNKDKLNHARKTIETRISMYSAHVETIPELAARLGITGAEHTFLQWEPLSFAGTTRMNTFGARGFSGGALLDLGEFTNDESYERDPKGNAQLAGMIIEYYEEYRALMSVKIDTMVSGIRRASTARSADDKLGQSIL